MRTTSDELGAYLLESISYRLIVDVFYGDERTFQDLPVTAWQVTWDVETATKSAGTLTVVYQDDQGGTLAPRALSDILAPFGQEVALLVEVSFGDLFTETVLLGRFRITGAPRAVEDRFGFEGRAYVLGTTIQLDIGDLLTVPDGWAFRGPSVPKYTTSTWDEIRAISGLPVNPNLPNKPTPADLVYTPGQGGRTAAIQGLMSYLGGIPVTNEFGELTALPYTAGPAVLTLTMGPYGQLIDVDADLNSGQVVNEVLGEYQDDDGNPIYAWAVVSDGPLAVDSPFGTRTAPTDHDDTVKTTEAAKTRVGKLLRQYLRAHTVRYTLTCLLDPRLQAGDVVDVVGPSTRASLARMTAPAYLLTAARVVSVVMGSQQAGLMTVVVDAGAGLEARIRVGP